MTTETKSPNPIKGRFVGNPIIVVLLFPALLPDLFELFHLGFSQLVFKVVLSSSKVILLLHILQIVLRFDCDVC